MTTVRLNQSAIKAFGKSTEARRLLEKVGQQVADDARNAAPKASGALAASIGWEIVDDAVRISWDRTHFYGLFVEVGTSRQSPRPFLRPALNKHRTI